MTLPEEPPQPTAREFRIDSKTIWLILIAVVLIPLLTLIFTLTRGSERPLTDSQAAKAELVERVEKTFSQRFGVPQEQVLVDLGTENPLAQFENQEAKELSVTVLLRGDPAAIFLAELTNLQRSWLSISEGRIRVGASFDVPLMGALRVGVSQTMAAEEGELLLSSDGFYLSGIAVPASELSGIPLVGDWLKQFTKPTARCIVDHVPAPMKLTKAAVNGAALELNFTGEAVPLNLSKLQETGSC